MFFTQDDYKKIQAWFAKNSVKDTEFNEAIEPLNGNETITLVQNGHNVKASLKDFISQLFLLGVSDFLNVSERFNEKYISLSQAIALIPFRSRKIGQVITFLNKEGNWRIYQFKGNIHQWNMTSLWEDILDFDKYIVNSILPDEEDLTKSLPETNGNSYLKFKDKEYDPDNYSGLGRVYLRKNIVELEDPDSPVCGKITKNLLYQDMIDKPNTIYIIQYDYDLNGQTIEIPENCVLQFEGGSLRNGMIYFNNTKIVNNTNSFIFKNITTQKALYDTVTRPEWWGAVGDGINDDWNAITMALRPVMSYKGKIELQSGKKYYISKPLIIWGTKFIFNGNNACIIKDNETTTGIKDNYLMNNGGEVSIDVNAFFVSTVSIQELLFENIRFSNQSKNSTIFYFPECNKSSFFNITVEKCDCFYHGMDSWELNFQNIRIIGFGNYGFNFDIERLNENASSSGTTLTFINCYLSDGGIGLKVDYNKVIAIHTAIDKSFSGFKITGGRFFLIDCPCEEISNAVYILNSTNGICSSCGYYQWYGSKISPVIYQTNNSNIKIINGQYTLSNNQNHIFTASQNNSVIVIDNAYITKYNINNESENINLDDVLCNTSSGGMIIFYILDKIKYIKNAGTTSTKRSYINLSNYLSTDSNLPKDLGTFDAGLQAVNTTLGLFGYWDGAYWKCTDGWKMLKRKGLTSEKPENLSDTNLDRGYPFFDTELRVPVWWNGLRWITADGITSNAKKSGTFNEKPTDSEGINTGFGYFCTDKKTSEGSTNGIMIYYKGNNIWVDALGRVVE